MGSLSVPRPRKACQRCKELKSRCRSAVDAANPEDPCTRCSRLRLDCNYVPGRKRGRRPGAKTGQPEEVNNDKHLRFTASPSNPNVGVPGRSGTSPIVPDDPLVEEPGPSEIARMSRTPSESSSGSSSSPEPQRFTGSLTKLGGPAARTALDHLEPYLGLYDSRPGTPKGRRTAGLQDDACTQTSSAMDPVALGVLSEAEAVNLFTSTMQDILVTLYMFDPQYSTYQHVRTKPVLFTTILWLGSTFFRTVLSPLLHGLADTMINRCITSGTHDLALAQALLITVIWSKPPDKSTGIKIAVVKAILWELRVDNDFKLSLPTDITLARAKLDRERTLVAAMSQNSLHCVIRETRQPVDYWGVNAEQIESWGPAHRHFDIHGDTVLSFSANLMNELGFQTDGSPEPATDGDWKTKQDFMQHALDVMLRDTSGVDALRHHVASVGHGIMMNLQLIRWQQSPSMGNLHSLLERIDRFVDAFAACASSGNILYWPHTSCVLLSQPAVIIFKMMASLVGPLQARAKLLLRRCLSICEMLSGLPVDHAIHHVRRCYRRVLGVCELAGRHGQNPPDAMMDTSPESLDSYYTRIFGFDPADPLFQYDSWAEAGEE